MHFIIDLFNSDIISWILIGRGCFMLIASLLLLQEPMLCGGKNTGFHRLLALAFGYSGFNAFVRASSKAVQIVHTGQFIPVNYLIVTELIYLIIAIVIVVKLGYDFFQYKEFQKIKHHINKCESCQFKTEILTFEERKPR